MMSRYILPALALGVAAAIPAAAQTTGTDGPPVIVTEGRAVLKRAPNLAWVTVAAETRATTPAEAQDQAAQAMTTVQRAIAAAGIPDSAVRTTGYSLQPDVQYTDGRSRVRGYIARNQIEVRVDDLSRLGAVLDAAGGSGATNMSGLRFDLAERASVEREALRLAVEDAMARASAIAAGANASVGLVVRIDEQRQQPDMPRPMMAMRAEAAQADTPVSPGEIEIEARVTLTVEIR
jgi:hypothetical protein